MSIFTPVQSVSGFQKSVKIWIALGSLSLLRTGVRRLTVLPAYCCLHWIAPSSRLSPAPVPDGAAVVAAPAAVVAPPAAVVALAAVVSLDFLSSLPHAAATRISDDAIAIDATRLLDLMLVFPLCEPVPGGSAARSSRWPHGPAVAFGIGNGMESGGRFRRQPNRSCRTRKDLIDSIGQIDWIGKTAAGPWGEDENRGGLTRGRHRAQRRRQGVRERVPCRSQAVAGRRRR